MEDSIMHLKINKKFIDTFNNYCYNKCSENMYKCFNEDNIQVHRCLKEFKKRIKFKGDSWKYN